MPCSIYSILHGIWGSEPYGTKLSAYRKRSLLGPYNDEDKSFIDALSLSLSLSLLISLSLFKPARPSRVLLFFDSLSPLPIGPLVFSALTPLTNLCPCQSSSNRPSVTSLSFSQLFLPSQTCVPVNPHKLVSLSLLFTRSSTSLPLCLSSSLSLNALLFSSFTGLAAQSRPRPSS